MEYVTPTMDIVMFAANVYMTLSLDGGGNSETDDDKDMNIDDPYGNGSF